MSRELGTPVEHRAPRKRWGSALFIAPLVLLWLVPILAFVVVVPLANSAESNSVSSPPMKYVIIGSQEVDHLQSVTVSITYAEAPAIRISASGVVTTLTVAQGSLVKAGDELLRVNDVPVLAYDRATPLYRDLSLGATGQDVQELSGYLRDIGLWSGTPQSVITSSFRNAIKQFQNRIGVKADGVFRLAYVAFMGNSTRLQKWDVAVGDTVSPAMAVGDGATKAIAVRIRPASETASLAALTDKPVKLTAGSVSMQLKSLGVTAEDYSEISDFVAGAEQSGTVTDTAPSSAASHIFTGLFVSLATPTKSGTVPASAVYVSTSGSECLAAAKSTARRPVGKLRMIGLGQSETSSGGVGQVFVSPKLAGMRIASDASRVDPETLATCK